MDMTTARAVVGLLPVMVFAGFHIAIALGATSLLGLAGTGTVTYYLVN